MTFLGKDFYYWTKLTRILETYDLENLDSLETVLKHERLLTEREIKQKIIHKISRVLETV